LTIFFSRVLSTYIRDSSHYAKKEKGAVFAVVKTNLQKQRELVIVSKRLSITINYIFIIYYNVV